MRMLKLGLLCLGMALGPLVAQAQTRVEVGRVKLMLAESGWKAQDVPAEDLGVDQGVSGMIRG